VVGGARETPEAGADMRVVFGDATACPCGIARALVGETDDGAIGELCFDTPVEELGAKVGGETGNGVFDALAGRSCARDGDVCWGFGECQEVLVVVGAGWAAVITCRCA
jgi:hypothetical protein